MDTIKNAMRQLRNRKGPTQEEIDAYRIAMIKRMVEKMPAPPKSIDLDSSLSSSSGPDVPKLP